MIVVGDEARREAEARWHRPPPLAVIPNGVPLQPLPERPPLAGRPARLLFVGRLTEQKGVEHLVPVLAAVRARGVEAELRVVGEGPLADEITAAVGAAGLDDAVVLAGFSRDPQAEMAAADVLLSPSAYEGLPFTPLEALAVGLPLVLSDIPPHRELVPTAGGPGVQVVAAGSPEAWADAVAAVVADPPAAVAAAHEVAEAHRVETMVEATLAVYRAVTG